MFIFSNYFSYYQLPPEPPPPKLPPPKPPKPPPELPPPKPPPKPRPNPPINPAAPIVVQPPPLFIRRITKIKINKTEIIPEANFPFLFFLLYLLWLYSPFDNSERTFTACLTPSKYA